MLPLISVVIPVYNVKAYIRKCVESVNNQTYRNLEIILVDDGSTDGSNKICDDLALEDDRVLVIHKKNGGLSDARNVGINKAKGKYITFIDSDDYVSNDYIEYLYNLLSNTNSDISICNPIYIYENKEKDIKDSIQNETIVKKMNSIEALEMMLYQNYYDTSAWGKLYKIELFQDIRYPVGMLFEDMGTTYKLFLKSTNIVFGNAEKYYYLQRVNSISNNIFNYKKMDYLKFAEEIYNYVEKEIPKIKNCASARVISVACNILLQLPEEDKYRLVKKKLYCKIVEKRKGLIFDKNVRKKNKVIILLSYFPYKVFIKIFDMIKKYNKRTVLR